MDDLIQEIKNDEGFSATVYQCTKGFDTIGYGTRMPLSEYEKSLCVNPMQITKQEAAALLQYRLKKFIKDLEAREPFVNKLPLEKQEIIAAMCYQMGVGGVLKFKGMWSALKAFDYKKASEEMLDSAWARQTPERAERMALKMGT